MPFNTDDIQQINSNEVTITFSGEDFSKANSSKLGALKQVLVQKQFNTVKFVLDENFPIEPKLLFIRFASSFFADAKAVMNFDLSGLLNLPQKQGRVENETRLEQIKKSTRERQIRETIEQFLNAVFTRSTNDFQTLNLSSCYFNLTQSANFSTLRNISRHYACIDLRKTHEQGKHFTLKQLYQLVYQEEATRPINKVLVSYQELPECLQAVCEPSDRFNLAENVEVITRTYRKAIFEELIVSIKLSPSAAKPVNIQFIPPLVSLDNEETALLAEALQVEGCKLGKVTLVPCNLPYLTPIIASHPYIKELDFSNFGSADEVLISLIKIFATNTSIKNLSVNYQLFLKNEFLNLIQAIKNNPNSAVKASVVDPFRHHIKLVDTENRLKHSGTSELALKQALLDLSALINRVQDHAESLANIPIIIDLLCLTYDLRCHLAAKQLLPNPLRDFYPPEFLQEEEWKIEEQREKPLVYFCTSKVQEAAFILSPSYDTFEQVMNIAAAHLTQEIRKKQTLWDKLPLESEGGNQELSDDFESTGDEVSLQTELRDPDDNLSATEDLNSSAEMPLQREGSQPVISVSTALIASAGQQTPIPSAEKLIRDDLQTKLGAYIKRIESYRAKPEKFSYGFWVFAESRGFNREVNYQYAKNLWNNLQSEQSLKSLFETPEDDRSKIVNQLKQTNNRFFFDIGLHSAELQSILAVAKDFLADTEEETTTCSCW